MFKHISRIIGTSILGLSLCTVTQAQEFYGSSEFGVGVGASTYFGDLNPNYGLKHIRPSMSIFYKHHLNPYISVRASFLGTHVGYKDSWNENAFQQMRNLEFKSYIGEFSLVGEFNFMWFETGNVKKRWSPYLLLGVAGFYYNPYVHFNGGNIALKPLGTEGQKYAQYADRKYNNISVAVPVGLGVKWWIKPGMNLGVEVANRFTFTDYMDDVSKTYVGIDKFTRNNAYNTAARLQDRSNGDSYLGVEGQQRGDRNSFDQYMNVQVTLSLQLKTYKCPNHLNGIWSL